MRTTLCAASLFLALAPCAIAIHGGASVPAAASHSQPSQPHTSGAHPSQDDALGALSAALDDAFVAWNDDRIAAAASGLVDAVRAAAQALAAEPDQDRARRLADEIEYALVRLWSLLAPTQNRTWAAERLAGVEIAPEHGAAHALLLRIQDTNSLGVAPLWRWHFVGPFDNERGAGVDRLPAAATEPGRASYDGKVREVAARTTPPIPPPNGAIEFSELLDPWQQASVVARTWVESDVARDALLYVAASSEARVWVAAEEVLALYGERVMVPDAHAVPIRLEAGWNEIAILVGGEDGPPVFTARLAEAGTARPLDLVQRADPPSARFPLPLAEGDPSEPPPAPGIRARVAAADDVESCLRRSQLAAFYQSVPTSARPGRSAAARAVELAPDSLAARVQHALALQEGGSSVEVDVNPWLAALDAVLAIDPGSSWAWRQRALHSGWSQPFGERALDELDRALERNPEGTLARFMRAALLERTRRTALAEREREHLLELPTIELWPQLRASSVGVLESNDPRRVEIAREAWHATRDPSHLSTLMWLESRTPGAGDTVARIEEEARRALEHRPWSVSLRLETAARLVGIGETALATRWLDDALDLAPERPVLHRWRSRALLAGGDEENAVVALERLLELDFSAEDDRRLLERLRADGVEAFHEPYGEPLEDILARTSSPETDAPGAPDDSGGGPDGTSREILLSRVVVDVQPDGTAKRYYRQVTRILDDRGARDMDRVPFRAFGNQEVRVLTANVVGPDGETRAARTGRSNWGMVVDLPPLERGDVVDLEWRVDDLRPTFFGRYFGWRTGFAPDASVPTIESQVVLRSSPELPLETHTRGGAPRPGQRVLDDGTVELTWQIEEIAPLEPEPFMPPADELTPTVEASSYATWESFGTWWWDLIEEEITVSDEMRAKVRELTADAETPLDKLRAVYDFVVTDIRYNAWEFGVHGYQPYSAPVIFSRGFGDCKDKAILLRALLGVVDIEAWPVLIDAQDRRSAEDHTLALVEHFNHCIAFVPEQEGIPQMFLDGTARHHPMGVVPAMDDGAKVLVVRKGGVERRVVPMPDATRNRTEHDATVRLEPDGSAAIELVRRGFGRNGASDRSGFTGSDQERRETAERLLTSQFGSLSGPTTVTTSDLEDLATDVMVEIGGRAEQVAVVDDGVLEVPIAAVEYDLTKSLASEPVSERITDVLLGSPSTDVRTTTIVVPAGYEPRPAPAPVELSCDDATFSLRVEVTEAGWIVRERFALTTNRIPVERYAAFRTFAAGVDEAQSAILRADPVQ